MAYLIADATGDFTAAATWKVANAAASALLDVQTANQAVTTAFLSSAAFTPGAITITGLCVKGATRNSTPTGTMSVRLAQAGVAVAGTTVTVNVADLPNNPTAAANAATGCSMGWLFFKFATPVTLVAATAYTLQCTTSSAGQVNLFRDGTANNWCRLLVTTTTAAPGAGDSFFTVPARTAAGARTTFTVTMDENSATDYGNASSIVASLGVGDGCTVQWKTSANTRLRLSGNVNVWIGGTLTIGTAAAPVPTGTTAILEFDCAAAGDFGIVTFGALGTVTGVRLAGSPRTSGKPVVQCLLTADLAVAGTTLNVNVDTGWLSGDRILIGHTNRTRTQQEIRLLNADAGASSMVVTVGATNAHDGIDPQAPIALFTRNVSVRAVTSSASWFLYCQEGIDASWAAFENYGGSATVAQSTHFPAATSSSTFTFCAFYDPARAMTSVTGIPTALHTFVDCVAYVSINISFITGSSPSFVFTRGHYGHAISTGSGGIDITLGVTASVTITATTFSGPLVQFGCASRAVASILIEDALFLGCGSSGAASGFSFNLNAATVPVTVRRTRFRRCASGSTASLLLTTSANGYGPVTFEDCDFVGNQNSAVYVSDSNAEAVFRFVNCDFESESSFTQSSGLILAIASVNIESLIEVHGCRFSQVVAHSLADIAAGGTPNAFRGRLDLVNTRLGAATEISTPILSALTEYVGSSGWLSKSRHQGVAGQFSRQTAAGLLERDASTFRTAAPSEKLTPSLAVAVSRFKSTPVARPVATGQQVTFSVYVYLSGGYAGSAPRLVVPVNALAGMTVGELVLDTHSGASGVWEQLTGTVASAALEDTWLTAYVDCDGAVGAVNIDDWTATVA